MISQPVKITLLLIENTKFEEFRVMAISLSSIKLETFHKAESNEGKSQSTALVLELVTLYVTKPNDA